MDIWQLDKLVLFIAFVIPGFISIKTYQMIVPTSGGPASVQLIDAVSYSSINYAFMVVPIYFVETKDLASFSTLLYGLFYIFTILIFPVLIALTFKKIRLSNWFQDNAPHPTQHAWDYVFQQRKRYWLRVKLKSGEWLGGHFYNKSFASDGNVSQQIYIEESWVFNNDGCLERAKSDTAGVLIMADEIAYIEFTEVKNQGE